MAESPPELVFRYASSVRFVLHEYFSKLYIRKGIRRDPKGPETPPPEGPDGPIL